MSKDEKPTGRKFFESVAPAAGKSEAVEGATTTECPWHKLPLQIETENKEVDGKTLLVKFAVCRCRVENNDHFGQRAWEQS